MIILYSFKYGESWQLGMSRGVVASEIFFPLNSAVVISGAML